MREPGDADGGHPSPAQSWPPPARAGSSAGRTLRWWPLLLLGLIAVVVVAVALHPRAPLATPTPVPPPPTPVPTRSVVSRTAATPQTPRPSTLPLLTDPAPVSPRTTDLGGPVLGITAGWELFGRGPDSMIRIELAKG